MNLDKYISLELIYLLKTKVLLFVTFRKRIPDFSFFPFPPGCMIFILLMYVAELL